MNNVPDLLAGAQKDIAVEITLDGAGAAADTVLVPALVGYFGVLVINKIIVDFTDPNTTFDFQDEDDVPLLGGVITYSLAFTTSKVNADLDGLCLAQVTMTANKALEVDIAGGGAAGTVIIHISYHYERP